jgi:hypothetical protein
MASNIKNMKNNSKFVWMLLPLGVLMFLAAALFVERSGIVYSILRPSLYFLDPLETAPSTGGANIPADCLVLYDSNEVEGAEHYQTVIDTLDSMRVRCRDFDVNVDDDFILDKYQTVIVAFVDLNKIEEKINDLSEWINDGGRILFSIRPDPSRTFSVIHRNLGIRSMADHLTAVRGVKFIDDLLLPGVEGRSFEMDWMRHISIPVQLEDSARVHLVSADEYQLPLLWEYTYGTGRVVVINTNQFNNKSSRGILGTAYGLLQDVFVYPVINSSIYFIDDFPSTIPAGEYEVISRQFNLDIQSFFVDVWWPDMHNFSRRYGIKYSGMLIETDNYDVNYPFVWQADEEIFQYFGKLLLEGEGEIVLQGYNHVPLCLESDGINHQYGYPHWSSTIVMQEVVDNLYNFSSALFPDHPFITYVPPSNVLCAEARQWLPEVLPDLRVISSAYLIDEKLPVYSQEFTEAQDGIIEVPRIVAGFEPNEYMQWAAINEIALHYVTSHFVYPDEILDDGIGAQKGWAYLRDAFDEYLLWMHAAVPNMREMTVSEGAMAVQRFNRLGVSSGFDNPETYSIYLENFYDEAWLMMRTKWEPATMIGGSITEVSPNLYLIEAKQPNIEIIFEE